MADRGQTEVLGYVLVFSVIVLSIAMVTTAGQAGLIELRDNQRTANVESGFSTLASNVDDVAQGGVPSRATELDLSGERLSLGPPITVTVQATDASDPSVDVFSHSRTLRPLVYHVSDGSQLIYANGGVLARGPHGGVAMLREPEMVLSPVQTIVPITNTSLNRRQLRGSGASIDRESRVLIRTERRTRRVLASTDRRVTLTVTVDSPRADAWASALDREIDPTSDDCTVNGGTAQCTYTTDRATVVATRIAISFQ